MKKAVGEVPLVNLRDSGQALGLLVAPVKYIRPAHIHLCEAFVSHSAVFNSGDLGCGFVIDIPICQLLRNYIQNHRPAKQTAS